MLAKLRRLFRRNRDKIQLLGRGKIQVLYKFYTLHAKLQY